MAGLSIPKHGLPDLAGRQLMAFPRRENLVRRGGQANVIVDIEMSFTLKCNGDEQDSNRVRGG